MLKPSARDRIKSAFQFLNRFTNYERSLRYPYDGWAMNLERVRALLGPIGSPEKNLKAIHIAGTKGKGSTSKLIQSILSSAGFRVGLYTSPHLLKVHERIRIADRMITDLELATALESLRPGIGDVKKKSGLGEVTYFELITAAAFFHFARKKVDFAVLETGLGGRYDATNICNPALIIITPISFDHTDILGTTIPEISREKAMIIKPGCKAIISVQPKAAEKVFRERAREVSAELFPLEKFYQWRLNSIRPGEMVFDLAGKRRLKNLKTRMIGPRQMTNAAAAVLAMDLLEEKFGKISDRAIRQGLWNASLAGRFQEVEFNGRKIILDGAHNRESAKALMETVALLYPGKKFSLIGGLSRDKDLKGFFAELKSQANKIIISRAKIQRAAEKEQFENALKNFRGPIIFEPSLGKAMATILRPGSKDDLIIVTGSFYLVGEALQWLSKKGIKIRIP